MKLLRVYSSIILLTLLISCNTQPALPDPVEPVNTNEFGMYFEKESYVAEEIPSYNQNKDRLPSPILEGDPGWVDMYWKCWQIAFRGLRAPEEGSPFVSNWLDERFTDNIFQWDTIFMTMFARYGNHVFPAIQSLDNFYVMQKESGYINREIREADGVFIHYDHVGGLFADTGWKNTINPPLFSWAEVESYRLTGDKSRFAMVLPVLEKYAQWLNRDGDPEAEDWEANGRISASAPHRLYWNTPLGSGMDNSPRPTEEGSGWVEMSSQMVIMYNNMAIMAEELAMEDKADYFRWEAQNIGDRINQWCWNEEDGFYYDVLADGTQYPKMTSGGFWPMLAGIASDEQAARLVEHLQDENKFWRPMVFPTLAADEREYKATGDYWLGGVWAPTNVMIVKGLELYGYEEFAAQATERYLTGMYAVLQERRTIFENYAPESFAPGSGDHGSRPNFVGWSGCGPIQLLIENVMGMRPNGRDNSLTWNIRRTDRHGMERLTVGDATVNLVCDARDSTDAPAMVTLESDVDFEVILVNGDSERSVHISAGEIVTVTVE